MGGEPPNLSAEVRALFLFRGGAVYLISCCFLLFESIFDVHTIMQNPTYFDGLIINLLVKNKVSACLESHQFCVNNFITSPVCWIIGKLLKRFN